MFKSKGQVVSLGSNGFAAQRAMICLNTAPAFMVLPSPPPWWDSLTSVPPCFQRNISVTMMGPKRPPMHPNAVYWYSCPKKTDLPGGSFSPQTLAVVDMFLQIRLRPNAHNLTNQVNTYSHWGARFVFASMGLIPNGTMVFTRKSKGIHGYSASFCHHCCDWTRVLPDHNHIIPDPPRWSNNIQGTKLRCGGAARGLCPAGWPGRALELSWPRSTRLQITNSSWSS